jgi:hypothetical protein
MLVLDGEGGRLLYLGGDGQAHELLLIQPPVVVLLIQRFVEVVEHLRLRVGRTEVVVRVHIAQDLLDLQHLSHVLRVLGVELISTGGDELLDLAVIFIVVRYKPFTLQETLLRHIDPIILLKTYGQLIEHHLAYVDLLRYI